ncbi:hypothetical protein ACFQBQ_18410 [Granulicella cerasi]|uniref:Uncharacterized protein n=1 Tax=Granulicella cerasi TaxID=741063 RepID=A0ABW1ZET1_9BACT|nr:hypothetical protein [Granulicella cerasi]
MQKGWVAMNTQENNNGRDEVLESTLRWEFGNAHSHFSELLWRCDATRAGLLYNRTLFGTQQEAEAFAEKMKQAEPDQMFSVEAIKASAVWN